MEEVEADDVSTRSGNAWKKRCDRRLVDNVWWKVRSLELPNNLLVGLNGTQHTARRVSRFSVA